MANTIFEQNYAMVMKKYEETVRPKEYKKVIFIMEFMTAMSIRF